MTNKYLEKIAESNSTNWQPYAGAAAGALALGAAGGLLGRRFGQAASKKALSLVDGRASAAAAHKFDPQILSAKSIADQADRAYAAAHSSFDKLSISSKRSAALSEVNQHLAEAEMHASQGNAMKAAFSRSKAMSAKKNVDVLQPEYNASTSRLKGLYDTSGLARADLNKVTAEKNKYITTLGGNLRSGAARMPTTYLRAGGGVGALSGSAGGYYSTNQG